MIDGSRGDVKFLLFLISPPRVRKMTAGSVREIERKSAMELFEGSPIFGWALPREEAI
jgi:hypothetical protein